MFPSTDTVLEGTRHVVAMQVARDPLVRQCVRQTFTERAKISIKPTKKGKKVKKEYRFEELVNLCKLKLLRLTRLRVQKGKRRH